MQQQSTTNIKRLWVVTLLLALLLAGAPAFALEQNVYRQFLGLDSRRLIWFLAQMHLFFGAFVLGVPLFAVTIEAVGWRNGEARFDQLAHEFTSLLSVAYAITAAFGGLLAFALFTLYPTFMGFMAGKFKNIMFLYALAFFAETLLLYLYYYGWDYFSGGTPFAPWLRRLFRGLGIGVLILALAFFFDRLGGPKMRGDMRAFLTVLFIVPIGLALVILRDRKSAHISFGILLNVTGTGIMMLANSWAGFMMSPVGVDADGATTGTVWQMFQNVLATPVAIHRMLGNLAFGGLVAGAYAAVRFIGAKTPEDKAHYDWMGYISNFVALSALIALPFAGYYLGREVYSNSAVMGNNMMGGDFSWTFILQAMLVGSLFIISNYYLWSGMTRIPGAERYFKTIKYVMGALFVSLAIWMTPHNLPLTAQEVGEMGGSQYHPTLKFMGLMPAKNAVVNLIILSTFFSFLLYKRANKRAVVSISAQGRGPVIAISLAGLIAIALVGQYALNLLTMDPGSLDLPADRAQYFHTVGYLLLTECGMGVLAVILALKDKGKLAQGLYLGFTAFSVVIFLGVYGFVVMEKASPFLRNVAVAQFLQLISAIILVSTIDAFLYKGAESLGPLKWGHMTLRSQYALLLLTFVITMNMGLMGFIRSGLRGDWHIFGIMRDTSPWSYTPTNLTMTVMVSLAVLLFMLGIAVIFWLGGLIEHKTPEPHP